MGVHKFLMDEPETEAAPIVKLADLPPSGEKTSPSLSSRLRTSRVGEWTLQVWTQADWDRLDPSLRPRDAYPADPPGSGYFKLHYVGP